ncbi:MAG TPA: nitrite reductase small subunit NirD [Gallionellaceae bacterium]
MSNWKQVATLNDIPPLGSRVIQSAQGEIALFRTATDEVFALLDKCPHKGGHLSQGIVYGKKVACPMHNWQINLEDGNAVGPDVGCARHFPVRLEGQTVFIQLES